MTDQEIIEWIRGKMKEYKISFEKMAQYIFSSTPAISAWMNRKTEVKLVDVIRMLKVLGYEIQIVKSGEGKE